MESLLSSLARLERNLKEHGEMEIMDEEANAIVKRVADTVGVGTNEPSGVSFARVYTYGHQLDKFPTAWFSSAIVVPLIAFHWVVVGSPERQRLFHLLFVESVGRERERPTVENKYIRIHDTRLQEPLTQNMWVKRVSMLINWTP